MVVLLGRLRPRFAVELGKEGFNVLFLGLREALGTEVCGNGGHPLDVGHLPCEAEVFGFDVFEGFEYLCLIL